jgi:hypothetical protein
MTNAAPRQPVVGTLGISVLLVAVWAGAAPPTAQSAEPPYDYKVGVCHGLRGAPGLDPSQPVLVTLPNGTSHRCGPTVPPRGLPAAKVELRDCVRFNCDPNAPYDIPRARRVVPE